jgi:modulator of FtsH protease
MNRYRQVSTVEGIFGSSTLDSARAEMIKKTYILLSISVVSGIIGGIIGSNSPFMINLFSGWMGWIMAMILLNMMPRIALAARNNPVLGVSALVLDGFVSGLILAPMLFLANAYAPDVVPSALAITGMIFAGVTAYVMTTKKSFNTPFGIISGMFFASIGIMMLNMFLGYPLLSLIIAGAIGIIGLLILLNATSQILNNPEFNDPLAGALMLFAGLFNIFIAVIHILMAFTGRDD